MNPAIEAHNQILGEKVVKALEKNNYNAFYVANRADAIEKVLSMIAPGETVGFAGSWTNKELGLPELISKKGNEIYDHNQPGLTPEQAMALRRKEVFADVLITGTNAITMDGQLVNTDAACNRVASMMFGPKKMIVVLGVNKIVKDVHAAIERIQTYAAPINNKRLGKPNPCVQTGVCMNCQGNTRICNVTTIHHKRPPTIDSTVIIIGEDLGF